MASAFHYDRAQRAFHWVMAALIFIAIALGIWARYLDRNSPFKGSLLFMHKSLGLTILVLIIARVMYRLIVGKPPYKQPLHRFNQIGSTTAHAFLYGLMILMPVSGYIFSGAGNHPLPFFGLFEWPNIVPTDKALAQLAGAFHYWGAWTICSVLVIHVLAVAWHHWIKKDDILGRMARSGQST